MNNRLENISFLLVLVLISALFLTLLRPFFGAVLWACVLALLFYPLQRRLLNRWNRPNLATLTTLLACICIGIIPTLFIVVSFFHQGAQLYQQLQSGQLNPAVWLDRIHHGFPVIQDVLEEFDVDISRLNHQLAGSALSGSRFLAQHAVQLGQGTLQFLVSLGLMIYLLFFMLRDGPSLITLLIRALPLGDAREHLLMAKFAEVVRATVKGNLVVAIVQGSLGGLIFWILGIPGALLWGVIMILLSMIPVVGAVIIWGPVAIYLFATGDWIAATVLTAFGFCIIGLVDNVMRPLLVSRDTKMPDYLVLLSTLGGISLFGLNGFIVGPLITALFMAFWGIFARDFNQEDLGV
jgi:predicted PurR-regulated permease PerM